MSEPISPMAKAAIEAFIRGIEDFDEDEAAHFFKELARRTALDECQIFTDEARKCGSLTGVPGGLALIAAKDTIHYKKLYEEEREVRIRFELSLYRINDEIEKMKANCAWKWPKVPIPDNCLIPAKMDKKYDVEEK